MGHDARTSPERACTARPGSVRIHAVAASSFDGNGEHRTRLGRALLLSGEPGIGKSALCGYAIECAGGMIVLSAHGMESEAELPFAGLLELFRGRLDRLQALPAPQVAALGGALALNEPTATDRFAVYAGVLSLLAVLAEGGPVLAVIDDVQWIDIPSVEAVLFAARRLGAERIGMLIAGRDDIVFSRSTNDPIDYAHTLELIAGAGFVVAAPYHVNNTQDDVRIDFINDQAGIQLFACSDGRPRPCSRPKRPAEHGGPREGRHARHCAQMHAAGAVADKIAHGGNGDGQIDADRTREVEPTSDPRLAHGQAHRVISAQWASIPGSEFPPSVLPSSVCISTSVPCTGLDTDEVKRVITELAVAFFGTTLKRVGNDGPHFTRYLAPKWLEKHEPMVARAKAFASADAICPPGQEVVCED